MNVRESYSHALEHRTLVAGSDGGEGARQRPLQGGAVRGGGGALHARDQVRPEERRHRGQQE